MNITEMDKLDGISFETSLEAPLKAKGFTDIQFTPKSSDFGADIIALKDGQKWAIQVKRSQSPVPISAVQEVLGGMAYYQCPKGCVITNAAFTPAAQELATRAEILLVARRELKEWIATLKLTDKSSKLTPRTYQDEALSELSRLKAVRQNKGLVIMASGLGKTLTAAFDVSRFEQALAKPAKVLYLAHQGIILEQAKRSFLSLFGTNRSYGKYDGEEKNIGAELCFATFQSIYANLDSLDKDAFDYIVVDEAHHTPAETRDKVVSFFSPRFLLGLTATPYRYDGRDIAQYFDDNIAINLPLEKALARELLTPIDYRVYTDRVSSHKVASILNTLESTEQVDQILFTPRSDKEIVKIVRKAASSEFHGEKVIVFCNTLIQMDHFSTLFPNCRTVSGRDSRDEQIRIVDSFGRGEFPYLLARDVLNEGIDIPDANVIVFLRNSESPVVFLQQLGRGLRKAKNKSKILVLDFVCNIERIKYVYTFCSHLLSYTRAAQVGQGRAKQKNISTITFDEQARDIIREILKKKIQGGVIVPLSAFLAGFDFKISLFTLNKLCSLGAIVPDYELPSEKRSAEFYFDAQTIQSFFRKILKPPQITSLYDESYVSRILGITRSQLHNYEKWGRFCPSWVHRNPKGNMVFYYTDQDIQELKKRKSQQ